MPRTIAATWRATAALALVIVCAPVTAWSKEHQGFTKIGGYADGSFVPAFTLDGETFDGLTLYQEIGGDEIALLPKLDKQKMFRGIIGYRYERVALELSYERTRHKGVFGEEGTGEATFQQFNVDTRIHPQVGIVLGYGYRPIWFDRATGMTDTPYELRPRFRESSRGVILTTLVTF